jgi:NADH-quinone oxidoreductase subunit A
MNLWALGIHFIAVVGLVLAMLGVSYILGERHNESATGEPYESGIVSTGSTNIRLSVQFYLVAMLFVIFDLEAVFIYAWAIVAPQLGWIGYAEVVVFIAILLVGLVYLWRQGALDWGTTARLKRMRASGSAPSSSGHAPVQRPAPAEQHRLEVGEKVEVHS